MWHERLKEIPKSDLHMMKEKLTYTTNDKKCSEIIFRNWYHWKKYNKKGEALDVIKEVDTFFLRVTCIKSSGGRLVNLL